MIDGINESATQLTCSSSPNAVDDCVAVFIINTLIYIFATLFIKRLERLHYFIIFDPLVIQINKYLILVMKLIVIDGNFLVFKIQQIIVDKNNVVPILFHKGFHILYAWRLP